MLVITHSVDQVKIKDISQLINGISKVLQKLLRYFNGTAISTYQMFYWNSNFNLSDVLLEQQFQLIRCFTETAISTYQMFYWNSNFNLSDVLLEQQFQLIRCFTGTAVSTYQMFYWNSSFNLSDVLLEQQFQLIFNQICLHHKQDY